MTLEDAIELLQHEKYLDHNLETPDIIRALLLGIEALKRIQAARLAHTSWPKGPLKGETK